MLLALPIIAAAIVSYIQFTFIRQDEYTGFRPFVWNALEDLKGIMRRRIPHWMQPLPAAAPKLTLPAPILTRDLFAATANQTITPTEVPIYGIYNAPFDIPMWIVLRYQEIRNTYFFYALCGATLLLCLTGIYALWNMLDVHSESAVEEQQRGDTGKPKPATAIRPVVHSSLPLISTLDSISDLISSNPSATDLRQSACTTATDPSPVNPSLHLAPSDVGPRLESPIIDSNLPLVTANESTWKELRLTSSNESPDAVEPNLSRHWHRDVMLIGGGPLYDTPRPRIVSKRFSQPATTGYGLRSTGSRTEEVGSGITYSGLGKLAVIQEEPSNARRPVVPLRIAGEYQEPPYVSTMDESTRKRKLTESTLATSALVREDPVRGDSAIGQPASGKPEPPLRELIVDDLSASASIAHNPSGGLTSCAVPETVVYPESLIGGTPDLLHAQIDPPVFEENLVPGSTSSATWVGCVALRDSLVYLCSSSTTQASILDTTDRIAPSTRQDIDGFPPINLPGQDNTCIDGAEDSSETLTEAINTRMSSNSSHGDDDAGAYVYSECIEHLRSSSNSSSSIGWMSQCSLSAFSDTPLITPSTSIPISQPVDGSHPDVSSNVPVSCTDFNFKRQLSPIISPAVPINQGSCSEGVNGLDSFGEVQPSGFSPANSDAAPTLSLEIQTLQSFLDDRTYAEVASVPSEVESARPNISSRKWRISPSDPQRPQSSGPSPSRPGLSVSEVGDGSWASHGSKNSMWARPPDPNSRGFGSRRGRARRAQQV